MVVAELSTIIGLEVCTLALERISRAALHEGWTRDLFDRLIVANAKARALPLITKDELMARNYRMVIR